MLVAYNNRLTTTRSNLQSDPLGTSLQCPNARIINGEGSRPTTSMPYLLIYGYSYLQSPDIVYVKQLILIQQS